MKILWPMIALCLVAGCERQSPTIMLPSDYKTVFSTDYADVTIYLDTAYIAPSFDELPSEKDFDIQEARLFNEILVAEGVRVGRVGAL